MKSPTAREPVSTAAEAREYCREWGERSTALEGERLAALRRLTEAQAARIFATVLAPSVPGGLRKSSGLVEQQRLFSRLAPRKA